uniref:Uncharacterized protein n=1 Tax=Chenopodium quinoa TaxID=63459 RepID=A0A803MVU7_CHEQI
MDPKFTEISQSFDRFKAASVRNDFDTSTRLLSQIKCFVMFLCGINGRFWVDFAVSDGNLTHAGDTGKPSLPRRPRPLNSHEEGPSGELALPHEAKTPDTELIKFSRDRLSLHFVKTGLKRNSVGTKSAERKTLLSGDRYNPFPSLEANPICNDFITLVRGGRKLREERLFEILDDKLVSDGSIEQLKEVANLARRCLYLKGEDRPTMKEVARELESIRSMTSSHPYSSNNSVLLQEESEYMLGEAYDLNNGYDNDDMNYSSNSQG